MPALATHRGDAVAGAQAMVPWLLGVAPFGLVVGVSAARADIPTLAGVLTGPVIFGGSAQVATIELLDAGAAPLVVVGTVLIINLRLVLYSAAMAAHGRGTPWWWRAGAAYLLIDPSFAVGTEGYRRFAERGRAHAYYLGGAAVLWFGWLAAIVVGAAGSQYRHQLTSIGTSYTSAAGCPASSCTRSTASLLGAVERQKTLPYSGSSQVRSKRTPSASSTRRQLSCAARSCSSVASTNPE